MLSGWFLLAFLFLGRRLVLVRGFVAIPFIISWFNKFVPNSAGWDTFRKASTPALSVVCTLLCSSIIQVALDRNYNIRDVV